MSKPDKRTLEYRTRAVAKIIAELKKDLPPGVSSVELHVKFADGGSVKVEGKA